MSATSDFSSFSFDHANQWNWLWNQLFWCYSEDSHYNSATKSAKTGPRTPLLVLLFHCCEIRGNLKRGIKCYWIYFICCCSTWDLLGTQVYPQTLLSSFVIWKQFYQLANEIVRNSQAKKAVWGLKKRTFWRKLGLFHETAKIRTWVFNQNVCCLHSDIFLINLKQR